MVVHPPDAVFTDPAVVGPGRPVHLALGADRPVFLRGDTAALAVTVREVYPVTGQRNNARILKSGFER